MQDLNGKLQQKIEELMEEQAQSKRILFEIDTEQKKTTFSSLALGLSALTQSHEATANEAETAEQSSATQGPVNAKKLQQDLRISQRAGKLAKDNLDKTKKKLERVEKEFLKYQEDMKLREEQYKMDMAAIRQKNHDQLQNSINESELDRSSKGENEGGRTVDMIKIIEEHNKQIEAKSRELEQLNQKFGKKKDKLSDLKRRHSEAETKAIKLRSALDNMKTFFKAFSTNYIKIIKQSNASLKQSMLNEEANFKRELEQVKQSLSSQIAKSLMKKDQDHRAQLLTESQKYQTLQLKLREQESLEQAKLEKQKLDLESQLRSQKDKSDNKIKTLKEKLQQQIQNHQSEGDSKSAVAEELKQRTFDQKRQIELLELQIASERERASLQVQDMNKELMAKGQQAIELREREASLQRKVEESEERLRGELKKLIEKQESERLLYLQKESEVSSARDNEKYREFRQIYEGKIREKDEEIARYREQSSRLENSLTQGKEGLQAKIENQIQEIRQLEKQLQSLSLEKSEFQKLQPKLESKISTLKTQLSERDHIITTLRSESTNLQKTSDQTQSQLQKTLNDVTDLKTKLGLSESKVTTLTQRIDDLENALDLAKFDLNDEIRVKDESIKELTIREAAHQTEKSEMYRDLSEAQEGNQRLYEQVLSLDAKVREQEAVIEQMQLAQTQQTAEQSTVQTKKKKLVKRRKLVDKELQTEALADVRQNDLTGLDLEIDAIRLELVTYPARHESLLVTGQVQREAAKPLDDDSAPRSPPIMGEHIGKIRQVSNQHNQEEEQFESIRQEDSLERRAIIRQSDQMDMAMRGGAGFRPPQPRAQGPPGMRGRGGPPQFVRPGMQPQFRAPMQQPQQMVEQIQPQPHQTQNEQQFLQQQIPQQDQSVLEVREPQGLKESSPNKQLTAEKTSQPLSKPPIIQAPNASMMKPNQTQQREQTPAQETQSPPQMMQAQAPQQNEQLKSGPITEKKESKPLEEEKKQQPVDKKPVEEEKKAPAKTNQAQQQQSILDMRNNRFFGMINGFITFLTRRRQAYTGKPASAMTWDEKKGRYVFAGQEESDDDVPPPPPPMAKKKEEVKSTQSQANGQADLNGPGATQAKEATDASDLTKPALPSFMANRGRGRGGRGGSQAPSRFPQTFGANQLSDTPAVKLEDPVISNLDQTAQPTEVRNQQEEAPQQEQAYAGEVSQLYTTTIDATLLDTTVLQSREERQHQHRESAQEQQVDQTVYESVRESQWLDKFSLQNDKVRQLKYKNSVLQQQLKAQREENEQTIENFTILCQDLKFQGIEEVEDLQQDIQVLKEQLRAQAYEKAVYEIRNQQMLDEIKSYELDLSEVRESLRQQRIDMIQLQVDNIQASSQVSESSQGYSFQDEKKIMELQMENEQLKWQRSAAETERLQKLLDFKDLSASSDRLKVKVSSLEQEVQRIQEESRRAQSELQAQNNEQLANLEKEKDNIKDILQKVQLEKDRIQEQSRKRVAEYEQRIKEQETDRGRAEQEHNRALRERESAVEQLKTQTISLNQQISGLKQQSTQKSQELSQLTTQNQQLQQRVSQLIQKNKDETEKTEKMLKEQLSQIQEMLKQKSQLLEQYESKQEEQNQELNSMKHLKHKLTENIVYLQNEIRKRDDLLESSEFGDFDIINTDEQSESSAMAIESDSVRNNLGAGAGYGTAGTQEDESKSQGRGQAQQQRRKRKTFASQLQTQLEDTRTQLKQNIEEKLKMQRKFLILSRNYTSLVERIGDINTVMDQQQQNCGIEAGTQSNFEQSSSLYQEEETKSNATQDQQNMSVDSMMMQQQSDELVNQIINKIFTVSRHQESEINEVKHNLQMVKMQAEESETLKFDIEILNDERQYIENELTQQRGFIQEQETKLTELRSSLRDAFQATDELRVQLREQGEAHERVIVQMRQEAERERQLSSQETERRIEEIHDTFKTKVLPEIKAKHQAKYKGLKEQLQSIQESLQKQLEEQKEINQTLEMESRSMLNQTQVQIDQESEEKERLKERLNFLDIEKQELQNTVASLRQDYEARLRLVGEELKTKTQELEEQSTQFDQYRSKMEQDFKEAVQMLKGRHEEKMKKFKSDLQVKVKSQFESLSQAHQSEMEELQAQSKNAQQSLERERHQHQEQIQELAQKFDQEREKDYQLAESLQQEKQRLVIEMNQVKEQLTVSKEAQDQRLESVSLEDSQVQIQREQTILNLNARVDQLQSDLQEASQQLVLKSAELGEVRKQAELDQVDVDAIYRKHELQLTELKEQLTQAEDQRTKDVENQQQINREIKTQYRLDYEKLQEQLSKVQEERAQLEGTDQESREVGQIEEELKLSIKIKEDEIAQLQEDILALRKDSSAQQEAILREKEALQDEVNSLREEVQDLAQQLAHSKDELQRLRETNSQTSDSALIEAQNQVTNLKSLIQQRETSLDELTNELKQAKEQAHESQTQLEQERLDFQNTTDQLKQQLSNQEVTQASAYQQIELRQKLEEEFKQEWEGKLEQKEQEFGQEREALIQHYTDREKDFQTMTEQLASKLKGGIKKEKDRVKALTETNEKLNQEKATLSGLVNDLKAQIDSAQTEKNSSEESQIKNLESYITQLQTEGSEKDDQLQDLRGQLGGLQTENQALQVRITKVTEDLMGVLEGIEVQVQDQEWATIIEKLKEVLQNYYEDQRSLRQMINEREVILQEKDQYLQERDQLSVEKSRLEDKFDTSLQARLEKRVRTLEEERSEMKSDFYIKINSFVSEIDTLKSKLYQYEPVNEEAEDKTHSANRTLVQEMINQQEARDNLPSFMDQSKTSNIDAQMRASVEAQPQVQRSGLFTSIASFFLTDSQLQD